MLNIIAGVFKGDGGVDPDFMFEECPKAKMDVTSRRKITDYLSDDIGRVYHNDIPWWDIKDKLIEFGYIPLQEDNTPWSGMLLGRSGRLALPLGCLATGTIVSNACIVMTWYKMESGRYEIVAYLS